MLAQEINKEKLAKEQEKEKGASGLLVEDVAVNGSASPLAPVGRQVDVEGDVKMVSESGSS